MANLNNLNITLSYFIDFSAQLAGYILEGAIISKMKTNRCNVYSRQVFYEYPEEVHEYIKNTNTHKQAIIQLYYLYKKEGRIKIQPELIQYPTKNQKPKIKYIFGICHIMRIKLNTKQPCPYNLFSSPTL